MGHNYTPTPNMSASATSAQKHVHDALPVLRRALRGGNVMRVGKIVAGI